MATFRLSRQYRRYSDVNLLDFEDFIHQQISTQTSVFTDADPTMTAYKDVIDNFRSAKIASGDGGRLLIRQKNVARKASIEMTDLVCNYVLFLAGEDAEIGAKSGFPFTKQPESRTITVPANLTVKPGQQPGELEVSVKRVPGAASYLHQYTLDPTKEDSWETMACTSAKCLITGLTPGTTYYFRVGVVGTKDQVLYSSIMSKVAS